MRVMRKRFLRMVKGRSRNSDGKGESLKKKLKGLEESCKTARGMKFETEGPKADVK